MKNMKCIAIPAAIISIALLNAQIAVARWHAPRKGHPEMNRDKTGTARRA
jgi:hypothetical protein